MSVALCAALIPASAFASQSTSGSSDPSQSPETVASADPSDSSTSAAPVSSTTSATSSAPANATVSSNTLPDEYYLNNLGLVTPAKYQSPWSTCWAFAIASAIESSILKAIADTDGTSSAQESQQIYDRATNSMVTKYPGMTEPRFDTLDTSIDISERAIGWFAHELQSEESGKTQAGEGYYRSVPDDPLTQFSGNNFDTVESALASRQNLLSEEEAPYRYNGFDGTGVPLYTAPSSGQDNESKYQDWSLDDSLRTSQESGWYVREVLNLQSPAILETDYSTGLYTYKGYNPNATWQIKQTLMDVGAVAISLESDTYIPAQIINGTTEIDDKGDSFNYIKWSQYNDNSQINLNHAVTIVGWDDSFSSASFGSNESQSPPSEGAWLCKNNWGNDETMRAQGDYDKSLHWGIPYASDDGNENASGFFWLSYYDHSIYDPIAFEVARTNDSNIYQYDYLGKSEFSTPNTYNGIVKVANVFTAENTELIDEVSAWTYSQDDKVHTWIYILPEQAMSYATSSETSEAPSDGSAAESVDFQTPPAMTGEQFKDLLSKSELLCEQNDTFDTPGFHTIDLKVPVLVKSGENFVVVQSVSNLAANSNGDIVDSGYLSLELMFTEDLEVNDNSVKASLVANPGESYVAALSPDSWMSIEEYNAWYADLKSQGQLPVDIVYGNALVKAISKGTSMGSSDRIYEVTTLQ